MVKSKGKVSYSRQRTAYVLFFILFVFLYIFLRDTVFLGNDQFMSFLDLSFMALFSVMGILAVITFYKTSNNHFLYIGSGFLAIAFLGGIDSVINTPALTQAWFVLKTVSFGLLFVGVLLGLFHLFSEADRSRRRALELKETTEKRANDLTKRLAQLELEEKETVSVLKDIEREKEQIIHERDKMNRILYSIGEGVFAIDREYKITMFNNVAEQLSGYAANDALGKDYRHVLRFVFERDGKENDLFIKNLMEPGHYEMEKLNAKKVLISKNMRRIPVQDTAAPLHDTQGNIVGCVVVFQDATREREIDQAKTEFVSLASHQLKTPLSTINWYMEMLLEDKDLKLNDQQKGFLQEIQNGIQRMVNLVNSLLNVSRIELGSLSIDPEPVDLREIVDDSLKDLQLDIRAKEMTIQTQFEELPLISFDPKSISMVVDNLLSNAIKYTPSRGSIHVALNRDGENLLLSVTDTGYGIPVEQRDKIFTKLFRADNVRQRDTDGTGLGLYIVKLIVEKADGKVWFDSEEDIGTTFFVTLPLSGMKKEEGEKSLV